MADQLGGAGDVAGEASRQLGPDRAPMCVDAGMDLSREPAAKAAETMISTPLFRLHAVDGHARPKRRSSGRRHRELLSSRPPGDPRCELGPETWRSLTRGKPRCLLGRCGAIACRLRSLRSGPSITKLHFRSSDHQMFAPECAERADELTAKKIVGSQSRNGPLFVTLARSPVLRTGCVRESVRQSVSAMTACRRSGGASHSFMSSVNQALTLRLMQPWRSPTVRALGRRPRHEHRDPRCPL